MYVIKLLNIVLPSCGHWAMGTGWDVSNSKRTPKIPWLYSHDPQSGNTSWLSNLMVSFKEMNSGGFEVYNELQFSQA